jgi:hypothetical protein
MEIYEWYDIINRYNCNWIQSINISFCHDSSPDIFYHLGSCYFFGCIWCCKKRTI